MLDLDIEKLKTVLVDLSKLSNAVKNKVAKTIVFDHLVKQVAIQIINTFDWDF